MYENSCDTGLEPGSSRIEDLSAAEIRRVLFASGEELSPEQIDALEDFIANVGGLDNALLAVELLSQLEKAA